MHARVAGREIAAVGPDSPPERRAPGAFDPHHRPKREAVPWALGQLHCQPVVRRRGAVHQQAHRPAVVRDDDVDVAVVVDIAEGGGAADIGASERRSRRR